MQKSIAVLVLTVTVTQRKPRNLVLTNNLNEQAAQMKLVSDLFLSVEQRAENRSNRQFSLHEGGDSTTTKNIEQLLTSVEKTEEQNFRTL